MKLFQRRREEPDLNLTPLIDVVFLLLIFFMVSTTFKEEAALSIELPEAVSEADKTESKSVTITIDAKGRYSVNNQEVINTQRETLQRAVKKAAGEQTDPQIILNADRDTPHQAVITAMDVARQLGFVHITFAATQPGGEQ